MSIDKLALTKKIIHVTVGAGVSKVVNDIIENNTTVETPLDVVKVWIGSIMIGSMVADHGRKHLDTKLDKMVSTWEEHKAKAETPA